MRFWKWFGWDTKDARTERNYNNNWHGTLRTAMWCIVLAVGLYACAQTW